MKIHDFINSMSVSVESSDEASGCLIARTKTQKRLSDYRHAEIDDPSSRKGKRVYFPVRPGNASTIQKLQGANLEHVTNFLDRPRTATAAYYGLSRVQCDKDNLIGSWEEREHFRVSRRIICSVYVCLGQHVMQPSPSKEKS